MLNEQAAPLARALHLPPATMDDSVLSPVDKARLADALTGARRALVDAAVTDPVAAAALTLAGTPTTADIAALVKRLSAAGSGGSRSGRADDLAALGPSLYAVASADVEGGRPGDATLALALLLVINRESRPDAVLGLAICAWRTGQDDLAFDLAQEALAALPGHPRAALIAGLHQLGRGQRKSAQAYLAAASRSARKRAEYREDLREAQRSLLLLHLT